MTGPGRRTGHPIRLLGHLPARANHDAPAQEAGERGTGVVASTAAIAVFLAFLFFAVQLLYNLYATSVVTATAYDAARTVASDSVDHRDAGSVGRAQAEAERQMRSSLGGYASRIETFDWSRSSADTVRLRIRADNPDLLIFGSGRLGFDTIERTVEVRVEQFDP